VAALSGGVRGVRRLPGGAAVGCDHVLGAVPDASVAPAAEGNPGVRDLSQLLGEIAHLDAAHLPSILAACAARLAETAGVRPDETALITGEADGLLDADQVGARLGILRRHVLALARQTGGLPCVRLGRKIRFRLEDVLAWEAQRVVNPPRTLSAPSGDERRTGGAR
jgi:excisionase family DNA binding protein